MPVLHLGVIDQAYSGSDNDGKTTGEVAQILEDKYHIMRIFVEERDEQIGDALARKMLARLDNPIGGTKTVFDDIGSMFRDFLNADEISKIMPKDQQIQAAINGVNHRKKKPYAKANKARPAFVDTGLYSASFMAWVD